VSPTEDKLSSDAKTERLLNLTLALLATSRYIKKSELLRVIPGYEGSAETMERMFERDKDELRNIGIPIEVEQIDPLFEDEQGYRINPTAYQIQLPDLTSSEALLISAALQALSLENITRRTKSILALISQSPKNDHDQLVVKIRNYLPSLSASTLERIYQAIYSKKQIIFQYQPELGGSFSDRTVSPYGIGSRNGHWYLVGFDHFKSATRTFNVGQILSLEAIDQEIFPSSPDFSLERELEGYNSSFDEIFFSIPQSLAPALALEGSELISIEEERAMMKILHSHPISFFKILLSYSNQVAIISPENVKNEFSSFVKWLQDG
jgi:proteasome accessory factor B